MAEKRKNKPYFKAALMGVVSVCLYAALLIKQETINGYFTMGGMFAFLPIGTAFLFSYIHGSFTGHFWSILGVEAAKKHGGSK